MEGESKIGVRGRTVDTRMEGGSKMGVRGRTVDTRMEGGSKMGVRGRTADGKINISRGVNLLFFVFTLAKTLLNYDERQHNYQRIKISAIYVS